MMQGIAVEPAELAGEISAAAFERGMLIETAGAHDEVVKLLPPLILDAEGLDKGMSILRESFAEVAARHGLDEESGNVVSLKKSAS
jgi:diaminobutyrate-2-oxoglutarate transaminase